MELVIGLLQNAKPEEPSEELTPLTVDEETVESYDYDYNKRIWF
ncbi:hypothetical protein [Neobacillus niacini]|nr:hypothetical protein [Neobacillus niacini]